MDHSVAHGHNANPSEEPVITRTSGGRQWNLSYATCKTEPMLGPIIIILVLLVALPITFFLIGTVVAVILGQFLTKNGEASNPDSELIELNV